MVSGQLGNLDADIKAAVEQWVSAYFLESSTHQPRLDPSISGGNYTLLGASVYILEFFVVFVW